MITTYAAIKALQFIGFCLSLWLAVRVMEDRRWMDLYPPDPRDPDLMDEETRKEWLKAAWIHFFGCVPGFLLVIGFVFALVNY